MGKYLDAIKKISYGSGSALTKPTEPSEIGFVSFVGPHPKRLAENISSSDKKISPKHESYALTKLTEPPENGFVGFVSSPSWHFGKIFESSNEKNAEKNTSTQFEEISPKHGFYALTKLTEPPENGFVSAHTERLGKIYRLSDGKNDTRKNDKIPKCIPNELTKPTKLHSEAFHGIEPMTECLHGKPCKWLDCYPGERPGCLKAMDYVFDLDQCPIGAWGPMSSAIVIDIPHCKPP
jgi:hypothetical protein